MQHKRHYPSFGSKILLEKHPSFSPEIQKKGKLFYGTPGMNIVDWSTTQWSILLTNPVKFDPIYKNIIQIMGYCA